MPSAARPPRSEKRPSPITMTPTEAKNRGACFDCVIDSEPNERRERTGSVPSAKKNMIRAPIRDEPLPRVATCIDCVKPQGRKNVTTPSTSGASVDVETFRKKVNIAVGRVTIPFLKIPRRLSPRSIMITAASIPRVEERM